MDTAKPGELQPLLARHGFSFHKGKGQNFLTEAWVPDRMAALAGLDGQTGAVEIGPGAGALTLRLARGAGGVVALELDKRLPPLLNEVLAGFTNVEIVTGDVCKADLRALRARLPFPRAVAAANLPYNITKPAVFALLNAGCFDEIMIMVQKEVAEKLTAEPGGAALTAFSVLVQLQAKVERLFSVGAGCFTPRPGVDSAVVRLTPLPEALRPSPCCVALVKAGFSQRRKTLVNALAPREGVASALERIGLDARLRAEALTCEQWRALARALQEVS